MSSYGASWDDEKATIWAEGTSGHGKIEGIRPHAAMNFAVMLARNARAHGAAWPVSFADDPWEQAAVNALAVATGERDPQTGTSAPDEIDREEVLRNIELARDRLRQVLANLDEAERALAEADLD